MMTQSSEITDQLLDGVLISWYLPIVTNLASLMPNSSDISNKQKTVM